MCLNTITYSTYQKTKISLSLIRRHYNSVVKNKTAKYCYKIKNEDCTAGYSSDG